MGQTSSGRHGLASTGGEGDNQMSSSSECEGDTNRAGSVGNLWEGQRLIPSGTDI